jgi:hypothetical protein
MRKYKGVVLVMALVLVTVSICGCSKSKKASAEPKSDTTFQVYSDNSFIVTYSEDFSEDYYSKDELSEMVDKEIAEFNENDAVSKDNGISKDFLEVKDKKAVLKIKFNNYKDYNAYSSGYVDSSRNAKLFLGTYEEAIGEGYSCNTKFIKTDDSTELSIEDIKADSELYIMYTNEGMRIAIEGTIVAAGANVTVEDNIAKTSDKKENYIVYKLKKND